MARTYPPKPTNPDLVEVPLAELGLDRDQTVRLRSERGTFRVKHATRSVKSGAMWVTLYGGRPGYGAFRSVDRASILTKVARKASPVTPGTRGNVLVLKRKRVEK